MIGEAFNTVRFRCVVCPELLLGLFQGFCRDMGIVTIHEFGISRTQSVEHFASVGTHFVELHGITTRGEVRGCNRLGLLVRMQLDTIALFVEFVLVRENRFINRFI